MWEHLHRCDSLHWWHFRPRWRLQRQTLRRNWLGHNCLVQSSVFQQANRHRFSDDFFHTCMSFPCSSFCLFFLGALLTPGKAHFTTLSTFTIPSSILLWWCEIGWPWPSLLLSLSWSKFRMKHFEPYNMSLCTCVLYLIYIQILWPPTWMIGRFWWLHYRSHSHGLRLQLSSQSRETWRTRTRTMDRVWCHEI